MNVRKMFGLFASFMFAALLLTGCVTPPSMYGGQYGAQGRQQTPRTWSDIQTADAWAQPAIRNVNGSGMFVGYPDGTFRPFGAMSRQQGAAVADRLTQRMDAGDNQLRNEIYNGMLLPYWLWPIIGLLIALALLGGLLYWLLNRNHRRRDPDPDPAPAPAPLPAPAPYPALGPGYGYHGGGYYCPPGYVPYPQGNGHCQPPAPPYGYGGGNGGGKSRYSGEMPDDTVHGMVLQRFNKLIGRVDKLEQDRDRHHERLDDKSRRMQAFGGQIGVVNQRIDGMNGRIDHLAQRVDGHGRHLEQHDQRHTAHQQAHDQLRQEFNQAGEHIRRATDNLRAARQGVQQATDEQRRQYARLQEGRTNR